MEKSIDDVIKGWTCCSLGGSKHAYCSQCPYKDLDDKDYPIFYKMCSMINNKKCSMLVACDVNKLIYEGKVRFLAIPEGETALLKISDKEDENENCGS